MNDIYTCGKSPNWTSLILYIRFMNKKFIHLSIFSKLRQNSNISVCELKKKICSKCNFKQKGSSAFHSILNLEHWSRLSKIASQWTYSQKSQLPELFFMAVGIICNQCSVTEGMNSVTGSCFSKQFKNILSFCIFHCAYIQEQTRLKVCRALSSLQNRVMAEVTAVHSLEPKFVIPQFHHCSITELELPLWLYKSLCLLLETISLPVLAIDTNMSMVPQNVIVLLWNEDCIVL